MRVHDLRGADLDLWAAKAAGAPDPQVVDGVCMIAARREAQAGSPTVNYRPSSNWADGGAIIERERISVWRYPNLDSWHACMQFDVLRDEGLQAKHYYQGPTPLIAAMRCFIASKFGNEVPRELDR
jgi:Protein of unknown function (DUF2591)